MAYAGILYCLTTISLVLCSTLSAAGSASVKAKVFPELADILPKTSSRVQRDAAKLLIQRVIGSRSDEFVVDVNPDLGPKFRDTFQIKTVNSKVFINGTSGVAIAMGFYYYIKIYCGAHVSWAGNQVSLPQTLPPVKDTLTITSNDRFRYYQNVCTVSYSSVWWNWTRWEQEIDWMSMQGINFPLAFTGQELIWQRIFYKMGFTQSDLDSFFSGPAFLAWHRMGNLQGWGGPLPQSWHLQQLKLQHQILHRMRSLGIIPILPAFAGHVPAAIKRLFPSAKVSPLSTWGNLPANYTNVLLLDFEDPLFVQIGSEFIKEYTQEFGTDHVYNTDTFNEMTPISGEPSYLSQAGATVFRAISTADPSAIWVMQGWLFLSDFWTDDRIKALLTSVPTGKMIVLDLYSDVEPLYIRTKFYYGQPFIWCMLHDFGGTVAMYGALENINQMPTEAAHHNLWKGPITARTLANSTMVGIGLTPEGINQNNVVYEFMMENTWRPSPRNISQWLTSYGRQRYGKMNSYVDTAWQHLKETVYNSTSGHGNGNNLIVRRPSLHSPTDSSVYNNTSHSRKDHEGRGRNLVVMRPSLHSRTDIWYDPEGLFKAWDQFILAADDLQGDLFRYDLVDVTRQSLQVIAVLFYDDMMAAYNKHNVAQFRTPAKALVDLFKDLEVLLATDSHFLLGKWVEAARALGTTPQEKDLYEYNAKNQVTLWGPTGNILDYANKQWSGLIKSYYGPRWSLFVERLGESLSSGQPFDSNQYNMDVFTQVENPFTFSKEIFPVTTIGDQIVEARRIYQKYRPLTSFRGRQFEQILKSNHFNSKEKFDSFYSYNMFKNT